MSRNQQTLERATDTTEAPIPDDICSPRAKLVYLAVSTHSPVDVDELKSALGMSGLTLLPILAELTRKGHLTRSGGTYTPSDNSPEQYPPQPQQ